MGFVSPATDYVEAIEGEALKETEVLGRVTYLINSKESDDMPFITVRSRDKR